MAFAPPDLSILVKITNFVEFVKWLPITYVFTSSPFYILFPVKFISLKFQVPAVIITFAINKFVMNYFHQKIENDRQNRTHRKKMMFDILED